MYVQQATGGVDAFLRTKLINHPKSDEFKHPQVEITETKHIKNVKLEEKVGDGTEMLQEYTNERVQFTALSRAVKLKLQNVNKSRAQQTVADYFVLPVRSELEVVVFVKCVVLTCAANTNCRTRCVNEQQLIGRTRRRQCRRVLVQIHQSTFACASGQGMCRSGCAVSCHYRQLHAHPCACTHIQSRRST
jgi:hypothetical protein